MATTRSCQAFTLLVKPPASPYTVPSECEDAVATFPFACLTLTGASKQRSRLGANSLLDIVVFGRACAHHIAETLEPGKPHEKVAEDAGMQAFQDLDDVRTSNGPKHTSQIRMDMQKVMQSDAAVFRTQESLDEGVKKMDEVAKSWKDLHIKDRSMIWNSDLVEALELRNLLTCVSCGVAVMLSSTYGQS